MRQYSYEVTGPTDMYGDIVFCVVCRSWDDSDDNAEAWVRVVNWYANRQTAQIEADAFNANAEESRASLVRKSSVTPRYINTIQDRFLDRD